MIKMVHTEQFNGLGCDHLRGPHPGGCQSLVSLGGDRRIVLLWGTSLKIWPVRSLAGIWSRQWFCCSTAVAFPLSVRPVFWRWLLQLVPCLRRKRSYRFTASNRHTVIAQTRSSVSRHLAFTRIAARLNRFEAGFKPPPGSGLQTGLRTGS